MDTKEMWIERITTIINHLERCDEDLVKNQKELFNNILNHLIGDKLPCLDEQ